MRLTKVLNQKLFYRYKKNNFSILEVHFLTKPQIDRLLFRPVMSIFASHRSPIQYVPHVRSVVYRKPLASEDGVFVAFQLFYNFHLQYGGIVLILFLIKAFAVFMWIENNSKVSLWKEAKKKKLI